VDRGRWALFDDARQRGALIGVEARRLSRRLAIHKTVRAKRVEAQNPVANDLERHPADPGSLAARCAVVNRRQSQEPARLWPVFRALGQGPTNPGVKVFPQSDRRRHGELPPVRQFESEAARFGNPLRESASAPIGINGIKM